MIDPIVVGSMLAMLAALALLILVPLWLGLAGFYYLLGDDERDGFEAARMASSWMSRAAVGAVTVAIMAFNEVILSVGTFGDVIVEFVDVVAVLVMPFVGTFALWFFADLNIWASGGIAFVGTFVVVSIMFTRPEEGGA